MCGRRSFRVTPITTTCGLHAGTSNTFVFFFEQQQKTKKQKTVTVFREKLTSMIKNTNIMKDITE